MFILYLYLIIGHSLFSSLTDFQIRNNSHSSIQATNNVLPETLPNENTASSTSNTEPQQNVNALGSAEEKVYVPENSVTGSGLIFEKEFKYRLKNNAYTDIIQLIDLSDEAQAIQFRLQINKADDDSTILIFDSIEKGNDIVDPSWILDYNIIRGSILPNGASKDEVIIVLYNLIQNNGLIPGDYNELFKVNYRVADIIDLQDSVKSSIKISNAIASTNQGNPIDITPSHDEFKVIVKGEIIIPEFGLIFDEDTVYRLEDDSYIDVMKLVGLEAKAQAIQFKLSVNKAIDDNVILTFQNIQKGADISDQVGF